MTDLDRAFAELHGDALLRAVLLDGPDPIVATDARGLIVAVNEAAELLFGWPACEILGRSHTILWADEGAGLWADDGSGLWADGGAGEGDTASIRTALPGRAFDRRLRRSTGEVFDGELRATPIRGDGDEAIGAVVIVQDVTDQRRATRALADLHAVTSARDLRYQEKVERILEIGASTFCLPVGVVARVESDLLTVCHVLGGEAHVAPGTQCPVSRTFCGQTLARNAPTAIDDATEADPRAHAYGGDRAIRAYIGAPLNVDGERFGAISFMSFEPRMRAFTSQEIELVRLLGEWIGNEIGRERDLQALRTAHDRLRTLASTDDLTGVGNRRHFMGLARHDWERMRRTGRPLSLLVVDLDHFKEINDRHGHAVGDALLTEVASICRSSLRAADVFGRIGGEEFAVLLPEAGSERTLEVAERLREAIAEVSTVAGGDTIQVTASIGAATAADGDEDLAALMKRADTALYRAKNDGRNRVVAAAPPESEETRAGAAASVASAATD